jgi:hypothetical protein
MKDYTATVTVQVAIRAKDDENAEERAKILADAFGFTFTTDAGKPKTPPAWIGDQELAEVTFVGEA